MSCFAQAIEALEPRFSYGIEFGVHRKMSFEKEASVSLLFGSLKPIHVE